MEGGDRIEMERLDNTYSPLLKFINFCVAFIEKPVIWFRETVVEPNRQDYNWYHEKIRRVPTVDECYEDDSLCVYEADVQFLRDKKVDGNILQILKRRHERCILDNPHDPEDCEHLLDNYTNATLNYFIKYGDLGWAQKSLGCYMKQKHRMAWERRHGPVGSGKRPEKEEVFKNEKVC